MANPSEKAEAIARLMTAHVGTKVSANDPVVGLSIHLSEQIANNKLQQQTLVSAISKAILRSGNSTTLKSVKIIVLTSLALNVVSVFLNLFLII